MTKAIYISAAHKSSGKTTFTIGLTRALLNNGIKTQNFKKGPDYIDPIWLQKSSKRPCYNLDFYVHSKQEIQQIFTSINSQADIKIIEGNKGLFDGLTTDGSDSNAALANELDVAVILVIDCEGITRGIAPLLLGYLSFEHPKANIQGIVLNKVGGARHEQKLLAVIKQYTNLKVYGVIHKNSELVIDERHLGLTPSNEYSKAEEKIEILSDYIESKVDIMAIYNDAVTITNTTPIIQEKNYSGITIAVADDEAFGFYYCSDLLYLTQKGVEIKFFSPIKDATLPKCDALFIGGGFPEVIAQKLEQNISIRNDIKQAIEEGLPTYAECGGMMYLCETLEFNGHESNCVGILKAKTTMHPRPQGRGYMIVKASANHPWGITGKTFNAHEFHYSNITIDSKYKYDTAYEVIRGTGIINNKDGLIYKNLLANYVHLQHTKQSPWIDYFLEFIQKCKG